jgi:hypothetical protein
MALLISILSMGLICDWQERNDKISVIQQQDHYRINQPVPFYEWSIELDAAIQIYDARVRERIRTWTVWRSDNGLIEGDCASIGYPIPYDVQLTNPLKTYDGTTIEQAEPSGLYSSHNSIATWVREVVIVNDKVVITPLYTESRVTCYAYPVKVDYEKNRVIPMRNVMPSIILKDNDPKGKKLKSSDLLKMKNQLDSLQSKKE